MSWTELLLLCTLNLLIQLSAYAASTLGRTYKFLDLTAPVAIGVSSLLTYTVSKDGPRAEVQVILISLWAARFLVYLLRRNVNLARDGCFHKGPFFPPLIVKMWIVQGTWALLTVLPSLTMITSNDQRPVGWRDWTGWALWVAGFVIESWADYSKIGFREPIRRLNLWSVSRYPNYFGEILLWTGLYLSASTVYTHWWQHLFAFGPVALAAVITTMSAIPPFEMLGRQMWGCLPEYREYAARYPMSVNNNHEMTWAKIFYLAAIDYGLMWLMWAVAAWYQTEKLNELFGASIIGILTLVAYEKYSGKHFRAKIQTLAILLWSIRVTSYVFDRILEIGHDVRYGEVASRPFMFFMFWTAQGTWALATSIPSLILIMKKEQPPLNWRDWLGWTLFAIGFAVETMADYQKYHFRHSDSNNWDRFIDTGLWGSSRHPNYFGDILLWIGLYVTASTSFVGWEHAAILSPIYVAAQIITVTGILPQEMFADDKWGHLPEYQVYKEHTPVLIPFLKF